MRLGITVPPAVCQACFQETVEQLREDVVGSIKGFRQDKVRKPLPQLPPPPSPRRPAPVPLPGGQRRRLPRPSRR